MSNYGYGKYQGYDMRFRGCSALIADDGSEGLYMVQFNGVLMDPVMSPGRKSKPDDKEFRHIEGDPPEPLNYCIGGHPFSKSDFPHVTWSEDEVGQEY